ncbi:hypothetical protein HDU76_006803 [Blyttiomyces sp. JEL0837]|nr:hypothetical protein HDU76_006803 [Blyttiomyces sp. JEL0837]
MLKTDRRCSKLLVAADAIGFHWPAIELDDFAFCKVGDGVDPVDEFENTRPVEDDKLGKDTVRLKGAGRTGLGDALADEGVAMADKKVKAGAATVGKRPDRAGLGDAGLGAVEADGVGGAEREDPAGVDDTGAAGVDNDGSDNDDVDKDAEPSVL